MNDDASIDFFGYWVLKSVGFAILDGTDCDRSIVINVSVKISQIYWCFCHGTFDRQGGGGGQRNSE